MKYFKVRRYKNTISIFKQIMQSFPGTRKHLLLADQTKELDNNILEIYFK